MALTYSGITPTVVFRTDDLQNTQKLSHVPSTTEGVPGKFVANTNGVCISMVIDWIEKSRQAPGGVTDKSQMKSGLALALMQTAYMRDAFDDDSLVETHGLSVNTSNELKRKGASKDSSRSTPSSESGPHVRASSGTR